MFKALLIVVFCVLVPIQVLLTMWVSDMQLGAASLSTGDHHHQRQRGRPVCPPLAADSQEGDARRLSAVSGAASLDDDALLSAEQVSAVEEAERTLRALSDELAELSSHYKRRMAEHDQSVRRLAEALENVDKVANDALLEQANMKQRVPLSEDGEYKGKLPYSVSASSQRRDSVPVVMDYVDFFEKYFEPIDNDTYMPVPYPYVDNRRKPTLRLIGTPIDKCKKIDVFVVNEKRQHCTVVVRGPTTTNMRLMRFERPAPGKPFDLDAKHPLNPDGQLSFDEHRQHKYELLLPLLQAESKNELKNSFKPVLKRQKRSDDSVIMMAVNHGHVEMLLNSLCSAPDAIVKNLIVVPSDWRAALALERLGVPYYYNRAFFGDLSHEASAEYGDDAFMDMMWLKTLAVYTPLMENANVLFQDTDVVWYGEPWSHFQSKNYTAFFSPEVVTQHRYEPFYANTGFFYLRGAESGIREFWEHLTMMYDWMLATRSQQAVVNHFLGEYHQQGRVVVKMLDPEQFMNGWWLHRRRADFDRVVRGEHKPRVFHMNWTLNVTEKVSFLKEHSMWFVKDSDEQCKRRYTHDEAEHGVEGDAKTSNVDARFDSLKEFMSKFGKDCCLKNDNFED